MCGWALAACAVVSTSSPAAAQNAPAAATPGPVIGVRNVIHTVGDMDKTVAFYQEVFGLTLRAPLGKPSSNAFVNTLTDTGTAMFRAATFDIPGANFGLELTEFTGIERKPGHHSMQDPGNAMLNFRVRNIDATLTKARKAGAQIITTGGEPLKRMNAQTNVSNRAIFLRDPDGMVIEMEQFYPEQASTAPADSAVLGATMSMSASDADRTAAFWKPFGVDVRLGTRAPGNPTSMQLSATEHATFRGNAATIPGTDVRWTIFEFTGIPRTPYMGRIQDPGTPAMSLYVTDLGAAMAAVTASGARIVTVGGVPAKARPDQAGGNIFLRDPDGFLFELIQQ
jgi:catechol 2,3-dioxygenase-like lactoylglutathione lyase family enzyme